MRIKRSYQLFTECGSVHLFWRCHNKEYYLEQKSFKDMYLKCLEEALDYKNQRENCKIYAFCAMSNHFHQMTNYSGGSEKLSNFMRYAHSLFGIRYNRANGRSGKVAEGRPKTPLIQDITHEMKVHFYIEANPIRAKMRTIDNLKYYPYSSYGFYAYGIKTKYTNILTIPKWYIDLGSNPKDRQRKYRRLFQEFIGTDYSSSFSISYKRSFIGDPLWVEKNRDRIKVAFKKNLSVHRIALFPDPLNSA